MGWRYNPETGQSYQVDDGPSTDAASPDPYAKGKQKQAPTVFGQAAPAVNPTNPNNPPIPPPPVAPPPVVPPVQPISYRNGKQIYNPTTAPFGFDQSMPGVQEQMWEQNQNMWFESPGLDYVDTMLPQFTDPWGGESSIAGSMGDKGSNYMGDYWEGVSGSMNSPSGAEQAISGGYNDPNMARMAFDRIGQSLPGSFQPKFDAYYDRMKDKVMSDVNSQSAARGAYGSNAALNNSIGAGLDMEAQRAKAHTDFMLEDSANQREWLGMYGQQGRAADLSGLGAFNANIDASKYGLDKTKTLGELAFNADKSELDRDKLELEKAETWDTLKRNRLDSGISTGFKMDESERARLEGAFGTAREVQEARRARVNDVHDRLADFSGDVQSFITDNYDALLGGDTQISDQELQTMVAKLADERGWNQQQQDRFMRDLDAGIRLMTAGKNAKEAS